MGNNKIGDAFEEQDRMTAEQAADVFLHLAQATQASVFGAMLKLYGRFIDVQAANGRVWMTLEDFYNHLLVRGMVEYSKDIYDAEIAMQQIAHIESIQTRQNHKK